MRVFAEEKRFAPITVELETRLEIALILAMIEEVNKSGPEFHYSVVQELLKSFGLQSHVNEVDSEVSHIIARLEDNLRFEVEEINTRS